jgi:hypothetical protein
MQRQKYKIIIFGCVFACWQFASVVNADTELSKMLNCTEIELEAVIDQDASREDNLARLSKQFFQSVNTIEHCDREQNKDDAASSTDSDGVSSNISANRANTDVDNSTTGVSAGDMAARQNANQLDNQSGGQSVSQAARTATSPSASGSLVGTNSDKTMTEPASAFAAPSASNMVGTTPQPIPAETNTTGAKTNATEQDQRLTNGKTPDDIPGAANDSIFEAQIRAAAMTETDLNTKKNLWNEYRRYKGLPEQK